MFDRLVEPLAEPKQARGHTSWAMARISRSPSDSSTAWKKSSAASACAWYERTRASRMSARARFGPGASCAIASRSCASARGESPDSK